MGIYSDTAKILSEADKNVVRRLTLSPRVLIEAGGLTAQAVYAAYDRHPTVLRYSDAEQAFHIVAELTTFGREVAGYLKAKP